MYFNPIDPIGTATSALKTLNPDYEVGDLISGRGAAKEQYQSQYALDEAERAFNSAEAQKNRNWQEYMSNTQVQRLMKDFEAAGLNPYLAINQLSGSVGSGSSASSSSGHVDQRQTRLGSLGTTAVGIAMIMKALKYFI